MQVISELIKRISEPQILSYCGMELVNIYIKDDENFIAANCMRWICKQNKDRLNETDIRDCLLKCAVEDEEWTKWRNQNLTGIFYRKITFLPEIQSEVCAHLQKYLADLTQMYDEMKEAEQKSQEAFEQRRKLWEVYKVYTEILPRGGENGRDGYIDAEYASSETHEIIRMVSRDVFDVGTYSYPKRLGGSNDVFDSDKYTEAEKDLCT